MDILRQDEALTLSVAVETARFDKRVVETGRVRVAVHTEVEQHVLDATLHGLDYEVERVAIDRVLAEDEATPQPYQMDDGGWVIPVVEEVFVRRLMLREEVHLHARPTETPVREVVPLRRQTAQVDRLPPSLKITPEGTRP